MILFSDQTDGVIFKNSSSENFEFPKQDRAVNYTNQDEVFEIFEVQNQTELQEEITRRRKTLQTHIKGTILISHRIKIK